jgi:uncharacterized protein
MANYRAPDVYVEEIPTLPASVAEVSTAVPAFIGFTEKAQRFIADDLENKPTKIYSLKELEVYYGLPKADDITVTVTTDTDAKIPGAAVVTPPDIKFRLYYAIKMYFENGGAQCYVVSVGNYADTIDKAKLLVGLNAVAMEDEPTLLVIPEATELTYAEYKDVTGAMLLQCKTLGDRFAIFDVWNGDVAEDVEVTTADNTKKKVIEANREAWAGELKYGAAYYPFVKTTINPYVKLDETNVKVVLQPEAGQAQAAVGLDTLKDSKTAVYNVVKTKLKDEFVTMPPSGAVTGVYAATDAARGVWKAPANVALQGVLEPVVKLTSARQEDLNVDATAGKSINAIRAFTGKGTLVWGARTLSGNDNEWRYVSVRRFFNMVEESVKKATYWAVFEPNDANTWVKVRGMIENYLIDKWRDGALAGATPKDAFFVKCGLGMTMSAQDILQGRLNVEVGLAAVRPAEFIVLKFSHKLQTS